MKTVTHKAIKGNPLLDIEREICPGPNEGVEYGVSYDTDSTYGGCIVKSSLNHYTVKDEQFPLYVIIRDYMLYFGPEKGVEKLLEKRIIY